MVRFLNSVVMTELNHQSIATQTTLMQFNQGVRRNVLKSMKEIGEGK